MKNIVITESAASQFLGAMRNPDEEVIRQRNEFISDVCVTQGENGEIWVDCAGLEVDLLKSKSEINITELLKKEIGEMYSTIDICINQEDVVCADGAIFTNMVMQKKDMYAKENFMNYLYKKQKMNQYTNVKAIA
ncbi:MAG: hypothetical protein ACI4AD_02325 [Roseburia sp.]